MKRFALDQNFPLPIVEVLAHFNGLYRAVKLTNKELKK